MRVAVLISAKIATQGFERLQQHARRLVAVALAGSNKIFECAPSILQIDEHGNAIGVDSPTHQLELTAGSHASTMRIAQREKLVRMAPAGVHPVAADTVVGACVGKCPELFQWHTLYR